MKSFSRFAGTCAVVALWFVASGPGHATTRDNEVPSALLGALERCLSVQNDSERLRCTDTAARALIDATKRKDVVVVDRAQMKTTRRSLFGFSLPKIGLFGSDGPDDGEMLKTVETTVTRVAPLQYDRYAFTMADGARWNTTEAWPARAPKAGDLVVLKRGLMGSYMLSVNGQPGVRAMRVG